MQNQNSDNNWHYEVVAGPGARELDITASFPPGTPQKIGFDEESSPFIRNIEIADGDSWRSIQSDRKNWSLPSCTSRGCRIRYQYLLADAAKSYNDFGYAKAQGEMLISTPSTWLIHPLQTVADRPATLRVVTPPDFSFATGLLTAENGLPNSYQFSTSSIDDLPYSVFGKFRTQQINQPDGSTIEVAFESGAIYLEDEILLEWISRAAQAVTAYYEIFPLKRILVLINPVEGKTIRGITIGGGGGASIVATVGRSVTKECLADDWVMTHEMIHCTFPSVKRDRHAWIEEGIATYVEPFARLRNGETSAEQVWGELVRGLPQGLPRPGDRGLDNTPTWGRTYWGGALFCLLADIEIRQRTSNQRGLEDALRNILQNGGNVAEKWELLRAIDEGDRAIGLPVLSELYQSMKATPVEIDLETLWRSLGVEVQGDRVVFNENAPLAHIRRAITMGNGFTTASRRP